MDDEFVTQLNNPDGMFRTAPRVNGEVDLSVLRGRLTLQEAYTYVTTGEPLEDDLVGRAVRYTTAGALRNEGFEVIHTPTRKIKNSIHTSVVWPGMEDGTPQVPWGDSQTQALELAFSQKGVKNEP